jgi:hypothetical protein
MRRTILVPASILLPLCGLSIAIAAPASAEEDYRAIVEVLRACAEIEDGPARMTCYDANVRPRSAPPAARVDPPADAVHRPGGFGSESLPQQRPREEADALEARVASARERQPGKFVLTLEDGAEWEFVEAAPSAYNPPRAGASVRIERGSLGSFRLRYASQRAIRIRRVN